MTQLHFDTQSNQHHYDTKNYSVYFHLFFGGIILVLLLFLGVVFKKIVLQMISSFPIFAYVFIGCLAVGIVYYFYKIFTFKEVLPTQEALLKLKNNYLDKSTDFLNLLQIIMGFMTIATIIQAVFKVIDLSKENSLGNASLEGNYDMILQPIYIILACLVGITILMILSLRIKEIASDLYNNSYLLLKNVSFNNRGFMSDTLSPQQENSHKSSMNKHTQDTDTIPSLLPNYDNGFFYKKLFEINDNVQHLKQQVIVAKNDNITNDTIIHQLWDSKIYPFLNTLSERIKTLENTVEAYYAGKNPNDTHSKISNTLDNNTFDNLDNKISTSDISDMPVNLAPTYIDGILADTPRNKNVTDEIIKESTHKERSHTHAPISESHQNHKHLSDAPKEDEEEAFVNDIASHKKHFDHNIRNRADNTKEKTLKELSSFLEAKMQELYTV